MKKMTSTEIRNMWYQFFTEHGHMKLESAPLVPIDDDSLLWINAGVTPLKKYFDGSVVPENKRIVSVQKCLRTNDIENVGVTTRHQTFFEMMGNFSIGDYFKNEAIGFAFELLTSEKWFAIPKEKLYVTIYINDDEAYQRWVEVGMDKNHIVRLEGNFWEIGEGPCGPDSEIFYDRGEKYDPNHDAFEKFQKDEEQDRYVEIWNNVFSQYNAKKGLKREEYQELPHKNIDTGAGLERWACIFQEVDSNFDTDLFVPILNKLEDITGILYDGQREFKVIADHLRAVTVALSDGAVFENVGRGYVLRRLLRRSVRMGRKLGMNQPFLYELVETVIATMSESYKELLENQGYVKALIYEEEKLFHTTLAAGERRVEELMEHAKDKTISGYDVFKLYDTYGFPYELTLEYLEEQNFTTDKEEFDRYMEEAKKLARSSRKNDSSMNLQQEDLLELKEASCFLYQQDKCKGKVIFLFDGEKKQQELSKDGYVVFDQTCFYAESGGQVADTGMIVGKHFKARVLDVRKAPNGQHLHRIKVLDGIVRIGDELDLLIDTDRRRKIEHNHSSVHLLQYALQQIVSLRIKQAGSYVDEEGLRFDFNYSGKLLDEQITDVENMVNDMIQGQYETRTDIMTLEEAKKTGAMALFNEKYGKEVRVVSIGDSKELCGGTHVKNTREIGRFAIYNVESKGSNLYRIEAVTGDEVERKLFDVIRPYNDEMVKLLMKAKEMIHTANKDGISLTFDVMINNDPPKCYHDLVGGQNELEYVRSEVHTLEKTYQDAKKQHELQSLDIYMNQIEEVNGNQLLLMKTEKKEVALLKEIADEVLNRMGKGFILFANIDGTNVNFVARSNISLNAGYVVKEASIRSLGNGGGSPTFAQGGGKTIEFIDAIFEDIRKEVV